MSPIPAECAAGCKYRLCTSEEHDEWCPCYGKQVAEESLPAVGSAPKWKITCRYGYQSPPDPKFFKEYFTRVAKDAWGAIGAPPRKMTRTPLGPDWTATRSPGELVSDDMLGGSRFAMSEKPGTSYVCPKCNLETSSTLSITVSVFGGKSYQETVADRCPRCYADWIRNSVPKMVKKAPPSLENHWEPYEKLFPQSALELKGSWQISFTIYRVRCTICKTEMTLRDFDDIPAHDPHCKCDEANNAR